MQSAIQLKEHTLCSQTELTTKRESRAQSKFHIWRAFSLSQDSGSNCNWKTCEHRQPKVRLLFFGLPLHCFTSHSCGISSWWLPHLKVALQRLFCIALHLHLHCIELHSLAFYCIAFICIALLHPRGGSWQIPLLPRSCLVAVPAVEECARTLCLTIRVRSIHLNLI